MISGVTMDNDQFLGVIMNNDQCLGVTMDNDQCLGLTVVHGMNYRQHVVRAIQ